jgi:hypothetical protein
MPPACPTRTRSSASRATSTCSIRGICRSSRRSRSRRGEQAAFGVSPQIVNSEGANVYTSSGHFVLANTRGFCAGFPYSRHSLSVTPIAQDAPRHAARRLVQRSSRLHGELASPRGPGRIRGAARAGAAVGAQAEDAQGPVLFEAPLACGLLGSFVQAASGGSLYRKASFLVDALGKPLFAPHVSIHEDPLCAAWHRLGRRSTRRACAARARRGRRRRAARLLPVDLLGAQAGHEEHRQCRWRLQPRLRSSPPGPAATTSPPCCASSAPACWSPN